MQKKLRKSSKIPPVKVNDVVSATECTGIAQFAQGCETGEESVRAIYDIQPAGPEEGNDRRE